MSWSLRGTILGLALVGLACGGARSAPDLRVELDAFSGRPNPTWTLDADEAEEALRRLRGLPEAGVALPDQGLGYRGFVLTGGAADEFPGRAYVTSGLVALGDPERPVVYRDVNGLESFLIERARARGYGPVFERR